MKLFRLYRFVKPVPSVWTVKIIASEQPYRLLPDKTKAVLAVKGRFVKLVPSVLTAKTVPLEVVPKSVLPDKSRLFGRGPSLLKPLV